MHNGLSDQIAELQQIHKNLTDIRKTADNTIVVGSLPFEASAEGYDSIADCFDIELIVPNGYPKLLPCVRETSGKMDRHYDHVYQDGTLCLAIPVEIRRLYLEQPSLLGFINKLLIPYFFGYCQWKKSHEHPFGESEHGHKGIVQHYVELLGLPDEMSVLTTVSFLCEYGYRGHHPCPCGNGEKVRNCHGHMLRVLNEQHSDITIVHDFLSILISCSEKVKKENIQIPEHLRRQIVRILKKSKFNFTSNSNT